MAGKIGINRVTNANVYINGVNLLGRAEEVTLPQIKHIMAEHKGLGMVGAAEFPSGLEKMEAKFKWAALYPEVMVSVADPTRVVSIQVRASVETYNGLGKIAEVPAVMFLSGIFKEFPMGTFKKHDNAEFDTTMSVYYAKMVIGGLDIFEVDVLENIYKVAGLDILAQYRLNTGA